MQHNSNNRFSSIERRSPKSNDVSIDDSISVYLILGGEFYGTGGWERYVRELAHFLTNYGYLVKIICDEGKVFIYGTGLHQVKGMSRFKKTSLFYQMICSSSLLTIILWMIKIFLGVTRTIQEIKNDKNIRKIIHAHDLSSSFLVAFLLWKFFRVPYIVQVHGFPIKEWKIRLMRTNSMLESFIYFLEKVLCIIALYLIRKSSTFLLVNNAEVKSFYEQCGIPYDRIEIVSSAINLRKYEKDIVSREDAGRSLGLLMDPEAVIIGYVGGLRPEKNVETLVKAFEKFIKSHPNAKVKLLIVGDGPMRPILEEYVKEHNIDGYVSFLGYVPDAYRFLNAIDIFVLPSLSEGSPIALIEAMACGRAIIASNIPAIREIVEDGREALLFDPHSPEQLKEALLKLYYDLELRKTLGKNAKEKAKQYDVNLVFPKIVKIYQKVLKNEIKCGRIKD
jgi:glycosyltransferase involved in cell wall biosynthesis